MEVLITRTFQNHLLCKEKLHPVRRSTFSTRMTTMHQARPSPYIRLSSLFKTKINTKPLNKTSTINNSTTTAHSSTTTVNSSISTRTRSRITAIRHNTSNLQKLKQNRKKSTSLLLRLNPHPQRSQ